MKKFILIIAAIGLLSLTTNKQDKQYVMTEGQAILTYQVMDRCEKLVQSSDMSMKEGINLLTAMDSVKKIIGLQYDAFNKDTTKNKSK